MVALGAYRRSAVRSHHHQALRQAPSAGSGQGQDRVRANGIKGWRSANSPYDRWRGLRVAAGGVGLIGSEAVPLAEAGGAEGLDGMAGAAAVQHELGHHAADDGRPEASGPPLRGTLCLRPTSGARRCIRSWAGCDRERKSAYFKCCRKNLKGLRRLERAGLPGLRALVAGCSGGRVHSRGRPRTSLVPTPSWGVSRCLRLLGRKRRS